MLSTSYKLLILQIIIKGYVATDFTFKNNENGPIWVGIQGNPGKEHLKNGGFVLNAHQEITVKADPYWAGRCWARTWCNSGTNHCETGDCGNKLECNGAGGNPPATLVEITLKGSGGNDFYDISLVDGFNLPASIEPQGGQGDGGQYSCKKSACSAHVNDNCPEELKQKNSHGTIACKSACMAFNTDEYCCRGAHGTPETCKSSTWPKNYPEYFKKQCPDAYSYAYDDHKSTFTCKSEKYKITFGG